MRYRGSVRRPSVRRLCCPVESEYRMLAARVPRSRRILAAIRGLGRPRRVGALVASTALVAGGVVAITASPAFAAATGGVGATLPYVEVQAENSTTTGTIIGP